MSAESLRIERDETRVLTQWLIYTPAGNLIGTICAGNFAPCPPYSYSYLDLMEITFWVTRAANRLDPITGSPL